MRNPVHILIVEDLKTDFELAQREIRKVIENCVFQQVETQKDFLDALETFQPAVIISDYKLPKFDSRKALELTLQHAPFIPFIVWTGSMTENIAVDCMKAGANNYIIKENIQRLGPAVVHALGERQVMIERRQAEKELQQRNDDLALLNAINEAVIRGENLDTIMRLLAEELNRIFSSTGCSIYMLNPDGQSVTMQQFNMQPKIVKKIEGLIGGAIPLARIPIKEGGYFHKVLQAKRGMIADDPHLLQEWIEEFVETDFLAPTARKTIRKLIPQIYKVLNVRSAITIPLISDEKTVGLLDVSSANLFTENDLERIEHIARQMTTAIQRQQAHEDMQRSEEFLNSVQNALSAHVAILDEQGTIVRVNAAWRKFGELNDLDCQDFCIGMNYLEACDSASGPYSEEASLAAEAIRDVMSGRVSVARIEYPCHSPKEKRWFVLHVTKFEDRDRFWVVLAHENITERKRAELALRESEERYRSLFDRMLDGVYRSTHEGRFVEINSAMVKMFGYASKEEMLAVDIKNELYFSPEERGSHLLDSGQEEGDIYRMRRKDGSEIWVEDRGSYVHDEQGNINYHEGILRDVTDRIKKEEELRHSESQYRTVVEHQTEFIVRWKQNGIRTFVNDAYCRYFGLTLEQALSTDFLPLIHESDRPAVEGKISRLLSGEVTSETDIHRIVKPNGEVGWQEWTDQAVLDKNGRLIEFQSIGRDITERKQAEQALQQSEARYRGLFDNTPVAIWEEDFSETKNYLDSLKGQGVTDFQAYFTSHPEEAVRCKKMIKILDVNDSALDMYQAKNKEELLRAEYVDEGGLKDSPDDLIAILEGRTSGGWEGPDETLTGKPIEISLTWSVVPGFEQDYSKVIVTTVDITERKRYERELLQSQQDLAEAQRIARVGSWRFDPASNTVQWSDEVFRIFGVSKDSFNYSYEAFIELVHPDDREMVREKNEKSVMNGEAFKIEYRIITPSGWEKFVSEIGYAVTDTDGTVTSLFGTIQNITERKSAENEIKRSYSLLDAALEATKDGIMVVGTDRRIRSYNRKFLEFWKIPYSLAKKRDERALLEFAADQLKNPIAFRSKVEELYQTPEADSFEEVEFKDGRIFEIHSHPQRLEYNIVGRVWSFNDVTERKQAEQKLRSEEARYRGIFEGVQDAIFVESPDGNILDVNQRACEMFGYTRIEFLRKKVIDLVPTEEHIVGLPYTKDISTNQTFETINIRANGEHFPVEIRGGIYQFGDQQLYLVVLRDITDRKRAEQALQKEKERAQNYLDIAGVIMLALDQEGMVTLINQKGCEIIGYSYDEIIGRNWINNFLPEDSREGLRVTFQKLFAGDTRSTNYYENPILTKNGEQRIIAWHNTLVHDADGQVVSSLSSGEDITERKQAEAALRESEALYRKAIEVAGAVPYYELYYADGKSIKYEFIGDGIRQITGYGPDEFSAQLWDTLVEEVILTGDLAGYSLEEGIERVRTGEHPIWTCEHRIRDRYGNIHWVFEAAVELRNENGVSYGSIGTYQDITTRKLAEQELRTSEERFRQLAENIQEVFWMSDAVTGMELYISPAAQSIWGETFGNLLNNQEAFIESILPEDRAFVLTQLQVQRKGQITDMEYRVMRPDGSIRWVRDRAFPIFDDSGKVVRLAGIAADITERKQAEKELQESQQKTQNIIQHSGSMFYTHTADNVLTYVSPQSREILDCEPEEAMRRWQEWLSDNPINQKGIESTERAIRTGEQQPPYELELITKKKRRVWVHVDESPLVENGKTIAIIGSLTDITERKQAEEALRQSEERFRQLVNVTPMGVAVHTNGRLVFANTAGAQIIGANSPDEFMGQLVMDFVHPDDRKSTLEALQHTLNGEAGWYPREERFVRLDGSTVNVEVIATPLNYAGEPAVQVVFQDITERKRIEQEADRHLAEMQALYENGLALGQLLEVHEIGERVIETFSKHLSWHHVTIRLIKNGSDEMELVAFSLPNMKKGESEKIKQNFTRRVSKVSQGLSGWVAQTGEPVRTGNVHEYPQYMDVYGGMQSGLYMPLKIRDLVIGVISVESEKPNAFTVEDERLLATLANQASVAFENARLYQSAQQEIDVRRRIEDALRISETHYRELADSITDIFFELDQELRYTHWNKASELLTGVPAQSAIGKRIPDIFGTSEEQARIANIYEGVLSTREPRIFETTFRINEEKRFFEISAYPSTRGVSVVAKDVTERKRSEIILQKRFELMDYSARHSLKELMQKTADEVSELTRSEFAFFHFVEPDQNTLGMQVWSTKVHERFHVPASEGEHLSLDQAGVWAEAARQRRPIIQNDSQSLPNKKESPEGHAKIVRLMVIPIIRNEKIVAVMGVSNKEQEYTRQDLDTAERLADYAWDVTERKQMETALAEERNQLAKRVEERTSELIKANSNLARALRVKDEFLANMSHELRTPLNAILGLSESLAEQIAGTLNEKQLKYINTIGESGHHLLSLINDILDLAKIEAGQITLDINQVDINGVCQASLRMIKQLAQKKHQNVSLNIDASIGLIWADERRLKQMLVNLLSNAVKFTSENGELGLDVRAASSENRVEFTVWDNGIGISEEGLARLFQPFVQLDSGLARESTGTGLGLALVSQMARLHGGSVKVSSEPGMGSRFTIMLPWEPAMPRDKVEQLKNTGQLGTKKTEPKNNKKILLIEDTQEVIMMLKDYLEIAGYKVDTAQDGIDGLHQARFVNPDLILMDIQMPRMDGFETTQKLREDPKFKHVPIIALTALAMPNDRERCIAAGMDEYISKPVNLQALVKLIQKFLSTAEENTRPL